MEKRFVSIWFRHLNTDWFTVRQPHLKHLPFVLRAPSHGRMIITAVNSKAGTQGIVKGMVLADARAIYPDLQVLDDQPDKWIRVLKRIAEWCIRFTPSVAVDPPDGLLLDATGCSHLWGGDVNYLKEITKKLISHGYDVRVSISDTIGAAWGLARFGAQSVTPSGKHYDELMKLPPEALRLEHETVERLHKLGLHRIGQFSSISRDSLRRRFGPQILSRFDKAIGQEIETIEPVIPVEPYQERLPCLEPIVTAVGIEIALRELLKTLCSRFQREQLGLRTATLKCYRVDGKIEMVIVGTNRPSRHAEHIFKLFENKLASIEPDLGIELFVLEAPKVEIHLVEQEKIWEGKAGIADVRLSELTDRLENKIGANSIHRYLPDEHFWPERSIKPTTSFLENPTSSWRGERVWPLHLLKQPDPIEVTAPIPDYPPWLFIYKGKRHQIIKADGPERIEQEWWLQQGQHRDYYRVEDEEGNRYWIFRLGHYHDETFQWFLHGFFA